MPIFDPDEPAVSPVLETQEVQGPFDVDEETEDANYERESFGWKFEEANPDATDEQIQAAWDAHEAQTWTPRSGPAPLETPRNLAGRPRRGTDDPAKAEALLVEQTDGFTIEELRSCLAPGRPSAQAKTIRETLAPVVSEIRREHRATQKALAGALECSERGIERLAA